MFYQLKLFLLAVQFFTRIPVTGKWAAWAGFDEAKLQHSAVYFPLVGLLVAGLSVAPLLVLTEVPYFAAVLCVAIGVWVTGGFHEDGLADVADGLGGSYNRDKSLTIMKDSRVGTFAVLALLLVLFSKIILLVDVMAFNPVQTFVVFALGHVVSRACAMVVIRVLPHIAYGTNAQSKSKPLASHLSTARLLLAGLLPVLLLGIAWWYVLPWQVVGGALLMPVLVLVYLLAFFQRRLQGFNGDCLGATQQLCEVACLFGAVYSAHLIGML